MILVVGGAGYIGSHMLQLLRREGEAHLVFDNLEQGHEVALLGSPFFRGDCRSAEDLKRCFAENPDIDLVMHFAAYISVGESVRDPAKYYENNVSGTLNLLSAMRSAGVGKFVFSSTAAIFGNPQYTPIDEQHSKTPLNPYGHSKLMVETMLDGFGMACDMKSVCLRYFNAAGADPAGAIGEDHNPEEHLIPVAILSTLGKRPPMTIFGDDYDTPDGTCVRDYVHILDLAMAHRLAVRHLREGGESRQFNLGNGQGFSVKQVLETVGRVIGREVPQQLGSRRPGDAATLIASSAGIQREWGWSPQFPRLETIVEHAWNWHHSHPDGFA